MSKYLPKLGDLAEYTFDLATHPVLPDQDVIGDVVKVGKSYADVQWRGGLKERIRFRRPDGVTFKAA